MTRYTTARQARRALDARLAGVDVAATRPPRDGWVRAIRESLMMSRAELGSRMGVTRQAVAALEASERAGTVRLESLQRAGAALDCRLVYALVPNTTLQETVETQAARIVDVWAVSVAHTMALEDQAVDPLPTDRSDAVEDLIRSGRIWGPPR